MTTPNFLSPREIPAFEEAHPYAQSFRILVVIPTLGERLETLRRTLSSIRNQTGVLVDTLLVTKTKTPELSAIADQYGARIIYHPGNISTAINAGFAQAGEAHRYLCWLGDDDMLRPSALATSSELLERNPAAVVSYGACDYVDLNGDLLFNKRPPPWAPLLLQFIPGLIKQETCLFRLSGLRSAGGLDEKLKYTMDLDLLLKLRRLGGFVKTDRVLAAFCWHPGSLTILNRNASLIEAQEVQRSHARGAVRVLQSLLKYPIHYLILTVNWQINRRIR